VFYWDLEGRLRSVNVIIDGERMEVAGSETLFAAPSSAPVSAFFTPLMAVAPSADRFLLLVPAEDERLRQVAYVIVD
jgi:hypothetical protein